MWVQAAKLSEIPRDNMLTITLTEVGLDVLLARDGEHILASVATCPHGEVSLGKGTFQKGVVRCPGHGYEFDMRTGVCNPPLPLKLATLPTRLVGDMVHVQIDPHILSSS